MNDASLTSSDQKTNYESPYIGLSPNLYRELPRFVARISSRITTVIRIVNTIEEIIAVLPSHSQFRHKTHLYLDLHGLVLETSIYHWQDQPGSLYATGARFRNSLAVQLFVFHIPNTQVSHPKAFLPTRVWLFMVRQPHTKTFSRHVDVQPKSETLQSLASQ